MDGFEGRPEREADGRHSWQRGALKGGGETDMGAMLSTLKAALGALLILIGVFLALWTFWSAVHLYRHPETASRFVPRDAIREALPVDRRVEGEAAEPGNDAPSGTPARGIWGVLHYALPIGILGLCASVAGVFINGGARVLDGDTQRILRRLTALKSRGAGPGGTPGG